MARLSVLFALALALVCSLPACVASPDALGGPEEDGGAEAVDCPAPGDGPVDAGPCVPGLDGGDPCQTLVGFTCGDTCAESAACAASLLLRQYEPERCAAALDDTQTFPACLLGSCDALVEQACGGDPPIEGCVDAPGCAPARDLQARAADPDGSQQQVDEAKASCLQALEDQIVFAPCP